MLLAVGEGGRWAVQACPLHSSPGDLPNPGIESKSLASPELAGRYFTTSATWEAPSLNNKPQMNGRDVLSGL